MGSQMKGLHSGQPAEQQQSQHITGDGLAQTHGKGVEGEGGQEGGALRHEEQGDLRAHDDGVADHRRQGSQILVGHPAGPQGCQQRGGSAEDPVHGNGGEQQVGQKAAHRQSHDGLREEEGQHRHGLCHPQLHAAVLGDGQQGGEGRVHGGDDGGCGQLPGGKAGFGHKKRPPDLEACCTRSKGKRTVRPRAASIFCLENGKTLHFAERTPQKRRLDRVWKPVRRHHTILPEKRKGGNAKFFRISPSFYCMTTTTLAHSPLPESVQETSSS